MQMNNLGSRLVSIVMPVHNESSQFLKAINSIKEQDYQKYECFVVDDGSKDECGLHYEKIVQAAGDLFQYVRLNRSYGPATARNTGIKCCSGEIIFFLDSDDIWAKDYLSNAVRLHNAYPNCPIVAFSHNYTKYYKQTEKNALANGVMLIPINQILLRPHLSTPATSIKRWALSRMFVEGKKYAEDLEFFLTNLILSKCNYVVFSRHVCVNLSRKPGAHGGLSAAQAKMYLRSSETFIRLTFFTGTTRLDLTLIMLMRSIRAAIIGLYFTVARRRPR